jgi:hypothetical protein
MVSLNSDLSAYSLPTQLTSTHSDYNFFRKSEGTCSLAPDTTPLSHLDECTANPDQVEYYDASGYRRIPLTTCVGGDEMDKTGEKHPCPNKEDEFNRENGIGGVGLFFAIVIPIAVATSVGWWVWRNWEGKFGQIRLGECKSIHSFQTVHLFLNPKSSNMNSELTSSKHQPLMNKHPILNTRCWLSQPL